jgi:hypothetical protein
LDTYDPRAATASNEVLDYLLATPPAIAGSIRHLVVAVEHGKYGRSPSAEYEWEVEEDDEEEEDEEENEAEEEVETNEEQQTPDEEQSEPEEEIDIVAFHARLPALFKKTRNLRTFDYHNCPGLGLARESVEMLATCEGLQTFAVDTTIRKMEWNGSHAYQDPESWEYVLPKSANYAEPILKSTVGSTVTSLDLRHVSQTTFQLLASHKDVLASYTNLKHLKMDITEGDGAGSPQHGATGDYVFLFALSSCATALRARRE